MFFCNIELGRFLKLLTMHSRSLAEVIALFFSPFKFHKENGGAGYISFSEELLIKTQMLARLHELCKQQADVPGHMNDTAKDKTGPLAED